MRHWLCGLTVVMVLVACGDDDDDDDGGTSSDGDTTSSVGDGGSGTGGGDGSGTGGGDGGDGATGDCPAEICERPDPPEACADDLELVDGGPCPGDLAYSGCCDADGRYWFCDCGHEDCAWMASC